MTKELNDDRVASVFGAMVRESQVSADAVFARILGAQWVFGILCAVVISPYSWAGVSSEVHAHVWLAIILGGIITALPLMLTITAPGKLSTRLSVSAGQLMFSALLIHLMSGRIEAHFHVFVSLALLSGYRDRWVFVPAVLITIADHVIRGYYWPQSVFGTLAVASWRPFEHGAWVAFETVSLCFLIRQSLHQTQKVATLQCSLEDQRDALESHVQQRTQELSSTKAFQETILGSIDAGVCILDGTGKMLFVNERWRQANMFGTENASNSLPGANYIELWQSGNDFVAESSIDMVSAIREVQAGRVPCFVGEVECRQDDDSRWFHVRVNPLPLSDSRAVAIVHIEVTDTKNAQARAESFARLVLESPNEVYIVSQETGKFVEVNDGACRNLGYDREAMLAMTPADVNPDYSKAQVHELMQRVANNGQKAITFESTHRRKDGSTYSCRLNLHASRLEGEQVVVAFISDVTDQKLLEEKLSEARKLESVGQLAAGVAHEINTPMQCVFGNVEFLQTSVERLLGLSDHVVSLLEVSDCDWETERETIAQLRDQYRYDHLREQTPLALQEATEASSRVISTIRAMKIMSHPGSATKIATDIHEMIRSSATVTRSRWKCVAELELDFDEQLTSVEVLPAEISQVFINLIVNAADAIGDKIGQEPNELGLIRIETRLDGMSARIAITDSGCGIPDSVRDRIFDPFFTTKDVGKGTGQGLSISRDVIVNRHGGVMEVETHPGEGTTFLLRLPLCDQGTREGSESQTRANTSADHTGGVLGIESDSDFGHLPPHASTETF